MDGLAGLAKLSGDVCRPPAFEDRSADYLLLLREGDDRILQGLPSSVFELAVARTAIGIQVSRGEEPPVDNPQAGYAPGLD
jgi:hypothetical protein